MREHEYDFPFRLVRGKCWIASQFKRFRSDCFPISFHLTFTLRRAGIELSWHRLKRTKWRSERAKNGRETSNEPSSTLLETPISVCFQLIIQITWCKVIVDWLRSWLRNMGDGGWKKRKIEGQQEKYNAKYPGFANTYPAAPFLPCRLPPPNLPPPPPPFFIAEDPLYVGHSIDRNGTP